MAGSGAGIGAPTLSVAGSLAPAPVPAVQRRLSTAEDLACGAAAGAVSRLVVGPLDTLKIRYQISPVATGRKAAGDATAQSARLVTEANANYFTQVQSQIGLQLANMTSRLGVTSDNTTGLLIKFNQMLDRTSDATILTGVKGTLVQN